MDNIQSLEGNSFPRDERKKLSFLSALFDLAVRRPVLPIAVASISIGTSPTEVFTYIAAGTLAYAIPAVFWDKKEYLNIHKKRGQFCDRKVNKLLDKRDAEGNRKYSETHPKVIEWRSHAVANRASYIASKGKKHIFG